MELEHEYVKFMHANKAGVILQVTSDWGPIPIDISLTENELKELLIAVEEEKKNQLHSCPYCGSKDVEIKKIPTSTSKCSNVRFQVHCRTTLCVGSKHLVYGYVTKEEARAAHNKRTPHEHKYTG